jgi:pimeloyl-ACP methyl ester carboxylesterase
VTDAGFIDAGGIRTRYVSAGKGRTVLLLHGAGPGVDAATTWQPTIPTLARAAHVVAPDLVGFGATERPAGLVYSIPVWLDHVAAVLDALDITTAAFVGNSFGAALALQFAGARPDRVDRLVLSGCPGLSFPLTANLEELWGHQPSVEGMRRILTSLLYRSDAVTDEAVTLRHQASSRPGVPEAYASMFPPPRQRWLDAMASAPERVAGIPHRTLIIHGRDDRVVPADIAWRLHHLIAPSQLHLFGECGHAPQLEHPDDFNSLLLSFLAGETAHAPEPTMP